MERFAITPDQLRVHYEVTGSAEVALVFVHGWLGNTTWWNAQRDHFRDRYTVVQLDLTGHGKSDATRTTWSAALYADDIEAVVEQLSARDVVLVGHSMAGAYVLQAAPRIARTRAVILVDTLKNLDQLVTREDAAKLFGLYKSDFRTAVESVLPQYLFSQHTPERVRSRLQAEFLANDPQLAVRLLEPLYEMDVREAARRVAVPVRAINADYTPTNAEAIRKYLRDYDYVTIAESGHYPMLEKPDELSAALDRVLAGLFSRNHGAPNAG